MAWTQVWIKDGQIDTSVVKLEYAPVHHMFILKTTLLSEYYNDYSEEYQDRLEDEIDCYAEACGVYADAYETDDIPF